MHQEDSLQAVRLDVWLWAARFYKTRQLAKEAIIGGKIHCQGLRAKPSKMIHQNDEIVIHKSPYKISIKVIELAALRGPYKEAKLLYEETEESLMMRATIQEEQKILRQSYSPPHSKPLKKERKLLRKLREKE